MTTLELLPTALERSTVTLNTDELGVIDLFAGYGGLHEGMKMTTGGKLIAVAEWEPPSKKNPNPNQAAARTLAHRYPDVPNLGDVTKIDWQPWAGLCSILCGGFPCQDVSVAGLASGLFEGNRSGQWFQFARAIAELRPQLVLIENVPGLRSAPAGMSEEVTDDETDDSGDMERDDWGMDEAARAGRPILRALGAVLGTLAGLGYDAEWDSVRASDVGAPHRRERVFILAYPKELARIA